MTETYSSAVTADDIDDVLDSPSERLSRQADDLLIKDEIRTFETRESIRDSIRADVEQARQWTRERAEQSRVRIQEEPLRATAYAVGVGVLIGLLLRR